MSYMSLGLDAATRGLLMRWDGFSHNHLRVQFRRLRSNSSGRLWTSSAPAVGPSALDALDRDTFRVDILGPKTLA